MAATMNAVRFHGKHDLRYEEIPVPEVKPGQVKIKPAWVGICGSGKLELLTRKHLLDGDHI